ncbi:winged helix DNA-binding domain-containing protein [Nitriliruptoraceae bacterium ZYF776]|nr:winged helix DNA-binding domain-containing protein [Profundirhabdus halotolerans]
MGHDDVDRRAIRHRRGREQLRSFEHAGRRYWHAGDPPPEDETREPRGHLLLTLDEFHNGYQDSRHVIDTAGLVPAGRRTDVGMVLVDGQMVGGVRRTVSDEAVRFEVRTLRPPRRGRTCRGRSCGSAGRSVPRP